MQKTAIAKEFIGKFILHYAKILAKVYALIVDQLLDAIAKSNQVTIDKDRSQKKGDIWNQGRKVPQKHTRLNNVSNQTSRPKNLSLGVEQILQAHYGETP